MSDTTVDRLAGGYPYRCGQARYLLERVLDEDGLTDLTRDLITEWLEARP
jgi:hypothetical protein